MQRSLAIACVLCLVYSLPSVSAAQTPAPDGRRSHWGITGTFLPTFEPVTGLYELLYDPVRDTNADGTEFRIGVTRGSDLGGDWSVLFVHQNIKGGSVLDATAPIGFGGPKLAEVRRGTRYVTHDDVEVFGVKYEQFIPFATIRNRAQIGITYGAGIGSLRGTFDERTLNVGIDRDPGTSQWVVVSQTETMVETRASDVYRLPVVTLLSVEAGAAFLLAPGLKARVTAGFNCPNTHMFSFTVNYQIGS